jgi:hypothetical protein
VKKGLFYATAALALACGSCGGNGLYPVSGRVTYKGDPAAGAVVHFRRAGADPMNEHAVMGIVQQDGSFTLVCGSLGPGAPPGDYDVLIEWRPSSNPARGLSHKGPDRLQGRYADSRRPLLRAAVKAETNHLPPFDLADHGPGHRR